MGRLVAGAIDLAARARHAGERLMRGLCEWGAVAADLLYPPACPSCGCRLARRGSLCDACLARCIPVRRPFCERCSLPFEGIIPRPFRCPNCEGRSLAFSAAVAHWRNRGPVRDLVHDFKYKARIALCEIFIPWLREALLDERFAEIDRPLVVPVPLHPVRFRERGYNQAALLAGGLARAEGWDYAEALRRVRYTTTQTVLDRAQRVGNLDGAFAMARGARVAGRHILLVDDVLTTCATVSECASVLMAAGADRVDAVVVARA